jgi:hypothetical protein
MFKLTYGRFRRSWALGVKLRAQLCPKLGTKLEWKVKAQSMNLKKKCYMKQSCVQKLYVQLNVQFALSIGHTLLYEIDPWKHWKTLKIMKYFYRLLGLISKFKNYIRSISPYQINFFWMENYLFRSTLCTVQRHNKRPRINPWQLVSIKNKD